MMNSLTIFKILCACLFFFTPKLVIAGDYENVLHYSISCFGKKIGKVNITESFVGPILQSETINTIDLKTVGEDYLFFSRSKTTLNDGKLTSFDHWIIATGDNWHLSGTIVGEDLVVTAVKLKTRDQNRVDTVTDLAETLATATIPYTGTALQILDLFTEEESEGEEVISGSHYDTTDIELYSYLLQHSPWQGRKKLKIFNTNLFEQITVQAEYLGIKEIKSGSKAYLCTGFSLMSNNSNSTLWLIDRPQKSPKLIKETIVEDSLDLVITLDKVGPKHHS